MFRFSPHEGVPRVPLDRRRRRPGPRGTPPWAVLAASLLLTLALSWVTAKTARSRDRIRFERAALEAVQLVERRLGIYIALLRGTSGLVAVNPSLDRRTFESYVARVGLREHYPGVQGLGLSLRLAPAEVTPLERRLRAEGVPEFRVTPDSARAEYHAIAYLAPLDERNRAALGFDMFTEPARREAMTRARDAAQPAMTGRVTLRQEIAGRRQAGFLIYIPVYRGGAVPGTLAGRRDSLVAYAYAPFRADDFFRGIFGESQEPDVAMRIFDGAPGDSAVLHDSHGGATGTDRFSEFSDTLQLAAAGRTWTMVVTPAAAFAAERRAPLAPIVALLGVVVSLALFALARARRRAVVAVAEARDLFGRVLEQAPVAICVLRGQDHVVEVANPPYRRLLAGNAIARPLRDVIPDAESHGFITTLDRVYASGTPWVGHGIELAYDREDGAQREPSYFNVLFYPFLRRDGSTDGVIAVAVDVTAEVGARRDAELARRDAEHANRAKSDFLAAMSHELRTPLNAITGYVQLIQLGVHGPVNTQQQEALARVQRSSGHLLSLINDVLNFAKLEAGRVEFTIRDVDLHVAVAEVVHMIEPQLEVKQLTCQLDVPRSLVVRADPEKLRQVLLNLLSNAVKFTEEGGIRVHASSTTGDGTDPRAPRDAADAVCLHVTDSGMGIPPERHAAVFEPFVQVNRGLNQPTEGTGLGLAISRDLARGMDAELSLESVVGEGSTFTLRLPRAGHGPATDGDGQGEQPG